MATRSSPRHACHPYGAPLGGWIGWALVAALAGWMSLPLSPAHHPPAPAIAESQHGAFGLCDGGAGDDCVIDGDTFRFEGDRVRIADIDAPETHPARCATEAALGARATLRLQALLNAGGFALTPIDRDRDRYGRQLRRILRDGRSIGDTLTAEGLARPYAGGHRDGWCSD